MGCYRYVTICCIRKKSLTDMCKAGAGGGLVSPYFGYSDFLANSTRGILLAKCKQDIHTSLRFSSVEARTQKLYQELAYSFASGS